MPRFRKRPVEVEAVQYRGDNKIEIEEFVGKTILSTPDNALVIETPSGNVNATPDDWIVQDVRGMFYPVKSDIFHKTYNLAFNYDEAPEEVTRFRFLRFACERIVDLLDSPEPSLPSWGAALAGALVGVLRWVNPQITCLVEERKRQDEKWGEQHHNATQWMSIALEEFGEAARHANELDFMGAYAEQYDYVDRDNAIVNFRRECMEAAAVLVACMEDICPEASEGGRE